MVYLIGAGPGDPGLITVKGLEFIKQCDTIIYDRLGTYQLLEMVKPDCRRIYVGKQAGSHYKKQPEINEILVEEGRKGNMVVRLKGGDPFVFGRGGEEEKSEREPLKLWGHIEGDHIVNAEKPVITAQCFRVPVSDGHTAAVFVSFDKKPSKEEILKAWAEFRGPAQELDLPSAPKQFLHYFEENDRPQPKLDRNTEHGMAVCIGRLREDTLFDYKFACMSHNTLRGAAGGAVLLAELLAAKGYFD